MSPAATPLNPVAARGPPELIRKAARVAAPPVNTARQLRSIPASPVRDQIGELNRRSPCSGEQGILDRKPILSNTRQPDWVAGQNRTGHCALIGLRRSSL